MGLFSKDEKVPAIPPAPTLPELPGSEKKDLPELPSFPANSKNEDFNQEMVKSAVADVPSPGEEEVHVEIPEDFHVTEEPSEGSMIPPKPSENSIPDLPGQPSITEIPKSTVEMSTEMPKRTMEFPSEAPKRTETFSPEMPKKTLELSAAKPNKPILNKPAPKQAEPIFVRIDKFQTAQKNFDNIKGKVKEIESVLNKIKGVKSQEEVELKGWTEDIEKIKSRLAEIDTGIFGQI